MSKSITLLPSNHQFQLQGAETVLEAALRSGYSPDYGCSSGNCGRCSAQLISGNIKKVKHSDYSFTNNTNKNNFLMCCNSAQSDLVILAHEASGAEDIPFQNIRTKVKNIDSSNKDISIVHLQTPRTQTLRFLAGQSIDLSCENKNIGTFYIASCPCDDRHLQLHIPSSYGIESRILIDCLPKVTHVDVSGPNGEFNLIEEPEKPAVFIALDHGFAPIKSIIEHAIALEYSAPIYLFRSGHNDKPYLHNLCRSWTDAFDDFEYKLIDKSDYASVITELKPIIDSHCDLIIYLSATDNENSKLKKLLLHHYPAIKIISAMVT